MKIPLLKPFIPKPSKWQHLLKPNYEQNVFSNFGPNYRSAVEALETIYGDVYPVLVNNGTTAIQVALQATMPRGSRIAIPHFTFMATLNAVVAAGMIPVIVESSAHDWTISTNLLITSTNDYDAFIVVSPMGHLVDVNMYDALSRRLNKPVIYDFAAASYNQVSFDNPTTLSFHATKNVPIGEGGAVLFADKDQARRAEQLTNFDFDVLKYPQSPYGFNGKLDEIHSAILTYQLTDNWEKLNRDNHAKLVMAGKYASNLREHFEMHPYLQFAIPQLTVLRPKTASILVDAQNALQKREIAHRLYYNPTLFEMMETSSFKQIKSAETPLKACLALPTYKNAPISEICDIIIKSTKGAV